VYLYSHKLLRLLIQFFVLVRSCGQTQVGLRELERYKGDLGDLIQYNSVYQIYIYMSGIEWECVRGGQREKVAEQTGLK